MSDFKSLSTANLPDPAIDPAQGSSPEDYFNTVLYTGNGSTQSLTGVGHQPDFLWFKNRNGTQVHQLFDVVRGVANSLRSNGTDAENTDSPNDRLLSFDSDGFSLGDDGNPNGSTNTYVAWSWKANGSGVSNTDGSITSTVSANTESGFSIGTFVGNQTAGATVGHGLSQAPEMIIIKDRPTVNDWPVYHTSISPSQTIKLNSTNAAFTESTIWNNTAPTTSVFTLGSSNLANNNTKSHVFYAFHSVEGFSKFGSYTGNGSADGPFVYTGFRPAFVMVKVASAAGERWQIHDTSREAYNGAIAAQFADGALVDNTTSTYAFDILSNGFKPRTSHEGSNYSGQTIIYMAFAENPFKYSNAR